METVSVVKRQNPSLRELLKTPQKRTYSLLFVTLGVVVVFFMIAIRPSVLKISDLQKEIRENTQIKDNLETKKNTLEELRIKYNELKPKIDIFNQSFPDSLEAGALMVNLDEIAKKNGLLFKSINFTPVQVTSKSKTEWKLATPTSVLITLEANYDGLKNFLSHLEKYPRILSISSVNVTNRTENQSSNKNIPVNSNTLISEITFLTFFYNKTPKTK